MKLFFDDADMDGQLQRSVTAAYSGSADVGEVLAVAHRITEGDVDSWWSQWSALAERTDTAAEAARAAGHDVSAARGLLRATEYWRQAWFFLRHDLDDERLQSGWHRHRRSFQAALELLPLAATRRYLAPRAAAAETRIAALVCDPGQVKFTSRMAAQMGEELTAKVLAGDPETDAQLQRMLDGPRNTEFWGARMATHGQTTFAGMLRELQAFSIEDLAPRIRCPTLITDGEGDFASQGARLRDLLTCETTYVHFDDASGAGGHCEGLGATLFEQASFDWLDEILGH